MNLVFLRHQFLVGAAVAVALVGAGCDKPADAVRPDLAYWYSLYSASDWTPQVDYHNLAVNWWTNSLANLPQGSVSRIFPARTGTCRLAEIQWRLQTNSVAALNACGCVSVDAGDSFEQAVELMMESFDNRSLISHRELATGCYSNLGDFAYVDFNPYSKMIDFVRNNIFVSVYSSDINWVTNTAFSIDAAILNASTNVVTETQSWLQRLMNK